MNIFKALSAGNGKISETNVTSFMSYLLDSSNELNNSFFLLFLNLIDKHLESDKLCDLLNLNQKLIRNQILSFSKNYLVTAEPEYSITDNKGRKQIPDILLRITSKQNEEDVAYLIIENKVNKGALKKGQIEKQLDVFLHSEDFDLQKPIYSILITTDEKAFEKMFTSAVETNNKTIWLKWTNHLDNKDSIEDTLRKLIIHEQNAEIEPIDPNTQFIFKSFIDYVSTELSYKERGTKNFSYKGFDEVGKANFELDGKEYSLKRFSNHMIRLFDKNDNLLEVQVKPILRKINDKYELDINLLHSTGVDKNTQILGREIINKLK